MSILFKFVQQFVQTTIQHVSGLAAVTSAAQQPTQASEKAAKPARLGARTTRVATHSTTQHLGYFVPILKSRKCEHSEQRSHRRHTFAHCYLHACWLLWLTAKLVQFALSARHGSRTDKD